MNANSRTYLPRGPRLAESRSSSRDLAQASATSCTRRLAISMAGADVDAAAALLGAEPKFGQSPFAIQAGDRFEASLRQDHYARWFTGMHEQLGFPPAAMTVVDLDRDHPWPGPARKDFARRKSQVSADRCRRTDDLLVASLTGRAGPSLILHPRLTIATPSGPREVEPDALLVWPDSGPRVAEVKSYVDHGHRTDATDLAQARRQEAVYVLALQETAVRLHAEGRVPDLEDALACLRGPWPGETDVRDDQIAAYTILRKPRSGTPSFGRELIERDVEVVAFGLSRPLPSLSALVEGLPPGSTLSDPGVIEALPTAFDPGWCLANCPMAALCRDEARALDDPSCFGSTTAAVLAGAGDLAEVYALVVGASPNSAQQQAVQDHLAPLHDRIQAGRAAC